jgi:hypothetical protein
MIMFVQLNDQLCTYNIERTNKIDLEIYVKFVHCKFMNI